MKGYKLNKDTKKVKKLIDLIDKNDGYCPCRIPKSDDTLCPCKHFIEKGDCICGMFIKNIEINKK